LISYFIRRYRIRSGLLADINLQINGIKEQKEAIRTLFEYTIKEKHTIPFPIFYNIGQYSYYCSTQQELASYINKSELRKVIKFYQSVWELDVSMYCLANTLSLWERDKRKLNASDIAHLNKRKDRINSYCQVLCIEGLDKIAQLPEDYRQIRAPETIVERT
jgi:hypothetical protein